MTDDINDQISAFIDDELSEQESAFLVRRFEHNPAARNRAMRYTVIGSAMRGELLQPDPDVLRRRIAAAMAGVPQTAAAVPRQNQRWSFGFAKPLVGVGIAASVALVALVGLRSLNEARFAPAPGAAAVTATGIVAQEVSVPPSYVVPQEVNGQHTIVSPIRLTNYLVHHGEYASRLSRTSVHSNVVGAAEDEPENAVTIEDAAVGLELE
jgi:negative regulator of sigma E activity